MTADELSAIAGCVLSLAFSYIPGVKGWFDNLQPDQKRGIVALSLVVVALAIFGLSCGGIVATVTCDQPGALGLVEMLIAALVANQATFLLSPKT